MASIEQLVEAARVPVGIDVIQMRTLVRANHACRNDQADEVMEFLSLARSIYNAAHWGETETTLLVPPRAYRYDWLKALRTLGFKVSTKGRMILVDWQVKEEEEEEAEEKETNQSPIKKRKKP